MKFRLGTQDFLQGLQLVSRAISSQQALPILGNIFLEAKNGSCILSATDLEISIITSIPATVEQDGAVTVPSRAILNVAQYNNDEEVTIEVSDGARLRCTSSRTNTVLAGEKASDYPTISPVQELSFLSLDAATLLDALNLVTFTAARTGLRPVLSGVSIRTEGGELILAATDSYRLSEYRIALGAEAADFSCIVPVKVLEELKTVLSAKKPARRSPSEEGEAEGGRTEAQPVRLALGQQQMEITIDGTRLQSRLIEGKFPDYRQIIPANHTTKALVNVREFTTAAKRMHYFAKEMNNNLTFSFSGGSMQISTPQTQIGSDEAVLPTEGEGGEGKIALSSSYLLDFLGHIHTDSVDMRITDSMHPAVFRIPAREEYLHLIMPLRMQEGQ